MYIEGHYAFLPNLPCPPMTVVGGHAYVSLTDFLADLLAHGLELDFIRGGQLHHDAPVTCISELSHAQEIFNNATKVHIGGNVLCLYINEWSDDFEPYYLIKANQGSAWLKTVTICPPHGQIHSLTHMYPIAIGLKGDNHDCIEKKFTEELLLLSSGVKNTFYHGALKKTSPYMWNCSRH